MSLREKPCNDTTLLRRVSSSVESRCTVKVGDKIWEPEQANLALNYQIYMYDESPAAKIKTLCEPLNKYIISNEDQNTKRKFNTP